MMTIGKWNRLEVLRDTPPGFFLGDDAGTEVLLPHKWVPRGCQVGDEIEVFLYRDAEGRPIATTMRPLIERDGFAMLRVKQVSNVGAFLDWGLEKDLFVPFREQEETMVEGRHYLVHLYLDKQSGRLAASSKLFRFLDNDELSVDVGAQVEVVIASALPIGYKAIVNNLHTGMIYRNEVYRPVKVGDKLPAYVKAIRPDNKIDLSLQPIGYDNVEQQAHALLAIIQKNGGRIDLGDKSDADEIQAVLQMSKKTFKKAAGLLFKQKKVMIEEQAIYLVAPAK
jgi:hypothetical protein